MRKLLGLFMVAILALTAISGAILAQDTDTDTPAEASTWLGIAVEENDGQVVIVRVMPQSPATEALMVDDVIVAFDGTEVTSAAELSELVQAAEVGATATLDLLRDGEEVSAEVTLGSAPAQVMGRGPRPDAPPMEALEPLDAAQRLLQADLAETDNGFEVVNVLASRNPFSLEIGDIVTTINGQDATALDLQTLRESLRDDMRNAETPALNVIVERDGDQVTLTPAEGMGFGFGGGRGPQGGPMGPGGDHGGPNGGGGHGPQGGPNGGNGAPPPPQGGGNGGNDAPPAPQDAPAAGAAI